MKKSNVFFTIFAITVSILNGLIVKNAIIVTNLATLKRH